MNRILEALKESSTWRGIISLLAAFGVVITPEQSAQIIAAGMAAVGLINIIRKEKKPCAN